MILFSEAARYGLQASGSGSDQRQRRRPAPRCARCCRLRGLAAGATGRCLPSPNRKAMFGLGAEAEAEAAAAACASARSATIIIIIAVGLFDEKCEPLPRRPHGHSPPRHAQQGEKCTSNLEVLRGRKEMQLWEARAQRAARALHLPLRGPGALVPCLLVCRRPSPAARPAAWRSHTQLCLEMLSHTHTRALSALSLSLSLSLSLFPTSVRTYVRRLAATAGWLQHQSRGSNGGCVERRLIPCPSQFINTARRGWLASFGYGTEPCGLAPPIKKTQSCEHVSIHEQVSRWRGL
eukprot:COSAG06_NODE_5560_length_3402_cov_2.273388_3_plen_293_part_00